MALTFLVQMNALKIAIVPYVIAVKRTEVMVGGAGNVARNLVALGARCIFVGVVGDDDAGNTLTKALTANKLIEFHLAIDTTRQTTRKVRFVSEHHSAHLLRADWEVASAIDASSEDALIAHAIKAMPRAGAVVLSDYAKGTLTPRVIRAVIDAANKLGKPVIVDPKGRDYSIYRGATLITPDRQELAEATGTVLRRCGLGGLWGCTESLGEFGGGVHQDCDQGTRTWRAHAHRRRAHAQRGDDLARGVTDRRCNADRAGHDFIRGNEISAGTDAL